MCQRLIPLAPKMVIQRANIAKFAEKFLRCKKLLKPLDIVTNLRLSLPKTPEIGNYRRLALCAVILKLK